MVNQVLSEIPDLPIIKKLAISAKAGIQLKNSGFWVKPGIRIKEMRFITHSSGTKWVISALLTSIALVFTFSYGWYQLAQPMNGNSFLVALVQPNMITRDFMTFAEQDKQLREYDRLTREAAREKPALIVWPASSLPAPLNSIQLVQDTLRQITHETGAYLLVGGAGIEKFGPAKESSYPFSNSEFLISPSGKIARQYHKILLVPFNEYLPLHGVIKWPAWVTTLQNSFIPGEEYTLFEISGIKFGTPICWESIFPDFFRNFVLKGAHFMVSVTNEGFFGHTSAPYQSLAINVFRAVENRVAIVRSAPTGVSAIIHPDGKIVDRVRNNQGTDLFVSGLLVREIPLTERTTFYTVYGDLFAQINSSVAVLMVLISLLLRKKTLSGSGK